MSVFKRWNGEQWEIIGPEISSTRFDNINNMIAPVYNPNKTYNIGDYVIQGDKLYKCIIKIEVKESWNPEKWIEIKLGEDVSKLRNNIVQVNKNRPTDNDNKIWVKPDDNYLTIPLLEDVMALPNINDYGQNGQYPRSTGNGIEWTDFGLPSDEQTATAISSWLNNHPEATTTVEDHSLTYEKFINGTLGYVTPEMFGAYGDGTHDDTEAIQAAIDTKLPVVFAPQKTYIVINFILHDGNQLYGNGATLKRPNLKQEPYNYTDADIKWLRMFVFDGNPNVNGLITIFEDLIIDINAYEIGWTPGSYKYEQGVCIMLSGNSTYHRKVQINGCTFLNNYASNVAVQNYVDLIITNSYSIDCFKGICTIVGSGGSVILNNIKCTSTHNFTAFWYEPNSNSNSDFEQVYISNCIFEGAFQGVTTYNGIVKVINTYINSDYIMVVVGAGTQVEFTQVTFVNADDTMTKIRGRGTVTMNSCDISKGQGILLANSTASDYYTTVNFYNCTIHDSIVGIAFDTSRAQQFKVKINGCTFKNISHHAIGSSYGSGIIYFTYCYITNCIFDITSYIFYGTNNATDPVPIFNGNNIILNDNLGMYIYGRNTIQFNNEMWSKPVQIETYRDPRGFSYNPTGIGKRTTLVQDTPTFRGINDIDFAQLTISPYTKYQYVNNSWQEIV